MSPRRSAPPCTALPPKSPRASGVQPQISTHPALQRGPQGLDGEVSQCRVRGQRGTPPALESRPPACARPRTPPTTAPISTSNHHIDRGTSAQSLSQQGSCSGVHTHTSIHVSPFTTAFQRELARIFKQAKNQNHSTCGPSAISLVQTPRGRHCTTTSSALALMTRQDSGPVVRQGQEDPSHRPQSPPPQPLGSHAAVTASPGHLDTGKARNSVLTARGLSSPCTGWRPAREVRTQAAPRP